MLERMGGVGASRVVLAMLPGASGALKWHKSDCARAGHVIDPRLTPSVSTGRPWWR